MAGDIEAACDFGAAGGCDCQPPAGSNLCTALLVPEMPRSDNGSDADESQEGPQKNSEPKIKDLREPWLCARVTSGLRCAEEHFVRLNQSEKK